MTSSSACSSALRKVTFVVGLLTLSPSGCSGVAGESGQVQEVDDEAGGSGGDLQSGDGGGASGGRGNSLQPGGNGGQGGLGGGVIVTTPDAGIAPDARKADADSEQPPEGWVPAMMAVGDMGLRVLSVDLGRTWQAKAILGGGGDDVNLLRGVAYGRGLWVAAGWRVLTSRDGRSWTEHKQEPMCKLMESVAYGKGMFLGACAPDVYRTTDGVKWTLHGKFGTFGGHAYIIAGNGMFAGSGDDGVSYLSEDGIKWKLMPGVSKVAFCRGEFRSQSACASAHWGHGTFLRGQNGGIARLPEGGGWSMVYAGANPYRFGFGYAPLP